MNLFNKSFVLTGLLFCTVGFAPGATMTLNGTISDSMCGASHAKMTAGHPNMTDRACTLACVNHGAQYVFVSEDKVYQISNQDLPALKRDAGESVRLTGDVNGDMIRVSKLTREKK